MFELPRRLAFLNSSPTAAKRHEPLRLLPSDVRYALQYRRGKLGLTEIEGLANSGFVDESVYLTLKMLHHCPRQQIQILRKVVDTIVEPTDAKSSLINSIETAWTRQPPETKVIGRKLALLSRQGFDLWDKLFKANQWLTTNDPRTPTLVAYAGTLGLRQFATAARARRASIVILLPEALKNPKRPHCGFRIDFSHSHPRITSIGKDALKRENVLLIDDTVQTGRHMRSVLKFWEDSPTHPDFISLCHLPDHFC
jgi:hypothetical protein